MVTQCRGRCGKLVIAEQDGKAYLCRRCWKTLIQTVFDVVHLAKEARPNGNKSAPTARS